MDISVRRCPLISLMAEQHTSVKPGTLLHDKRRFFWSDIELIGWYWLFMRICNMVFLFSALIILQLSKRWVESCIPFPHGQILTGNLLESYLLRNPRSKLFGKNMLIVKVSNDLEEFLGKTSFWVLILVAPQCNHQAGTDNLTKSAKCVHYSV